MKRDAASERWSLQYWTQRSPQIGPAWIHLCKEHQLLHEHGSGAPENWHEAQGQKFASLEDWQSQSKMWQHQVPTYHGEKKAEIWLR